MFRHEPKCRRSRTEKAAGGAAELLKDSWSLSCFYTLAEKACPGSKLSFVVFWGSFVCFLGLHLQHREVPRLGVESEPQLPASTRATATGDPSHVFDLRHSSRERWILNPLIEARD